MTKARQLCWEFPLSRTHAGAVLGNSVQGLMVWGEGKLHITVGRAGFWDHRGGKEIALDVTYSKLRRLLEERNEAEIQRIFGASSVGEGMPERPTQLGCGRLELAFPDDLKPKMAILDMDTAVLEVQLQSSHGHCSRIYIEQAIDEEIAWVRVPAELAGRIGISMVPAGRLLSEFYRGIGISKPTMFTNPSGRSGGWLQSLPEDEPLALAWTDFGDRIVLATALGAGALAEAERRTNCRLDDMARRKEIWWRAYWDDVPSLNLPDLVLQRAYDYGAYKQAGLTAPHGIPASLQGPWLEEYQPLPWSADYHFNINVQMVYWPALATNRLAHFAPLWKMIEGWWPGLQRNAEAFFEAEDALLLPHAVDDRCHVVGCFWTGTIDHGCTAWMAQMAWLHYRYSMDEKILVEVAWPMMRGAFNGYWAMLEENEEGQLDLPVSVSPEYGGSSMDACGRNASFQLAALHFLAETLPKAAAVLGEQPDRRWNDVMERVPRYAAVGTQENPRIALWEGQDLDESHRHPSHLAGIYPFRTLHPDSPKDAPLIERSILHWVSLGMGAWTGWAVAFGALIQARCGNADAAVAWLHWWNDVFTNEGYGTLHDALFPGAGMRWFQKDRWGEPVSNDREIMQVDAGMGVVTAILDVLVQCRGDDIVILPTLPLRWRQLSFRGIRTEGAFLVGAVVDRGVVKSVEVESLVGGKVHVVHQLGEKWTVDGVPGKGPLWIGTLRRGQKCKLERMAA